MIVKQICCCQWFLCKEICSLSMHTLETDFVVNGTQCLWISIKVKVDIAEKFDWIYWGIDLSPKFCIHTWKEPIFPGYSCKRLPHFAGQNISLQPTWRSLHFSQPNILNKKKPCYFKGSSNLRDHTLPSVTSKFGQTNGRISEKSFHVLSSEYMWKYWVSSQYLKFPNKGT